MGNQSERMMSRVGIALLFATVALAALPPLPDGSRPKYNPQADYMRAQEKERAAQDAANMIRRDEQPQFGSSAKLHGGVAVNMGGLGRLIKDRGLVPKVRMEMQSRLKKEDRKAVAGIAKYESYGGGSKQSSYSNSGSHSYAVGGGTYRHSYSNAGSSSHSHHKTGGGGVTSYSKTTSTSTDDSYDSSYKSSSGGYKSSYGKSNVAAENARIAAENKRSLDNYNERKRVAAENTRRTNEYNHRVHEENQRRIAEANRKREAERQRVNEYNASSRRHTTGRRPKSPGRTSAGRKRPTGSMRRIDASSRRSRRQTKQLTRRSTKRICRR